MQLASLVQRVCCAACHAVQTCAALTAAASGPMGQPSALESYSAA